jgi:hypothetical protein
MSLEGVSMRLLAASFGLLCLAAPAMAQEKGSFALDAMTTSGRHFGLGYYVADGLSVRPSLGVGYADGYGMSFNLGASLRWELMPHSRVSPYATASFNYLRDPYLVPYDPNGLTLTNTTSDVTRYGGGLGVRAQLMYKLSLVAEGLVMNSAFHDAVIPGVGSVQTVQPGAHFEGAIGISYVLN